jgi:hypothetical protein
VHLLAWALLVALGALLIWPWKTIEAILLGILVIFLFAWGSWSGGAAVFAALMAALCGAGLILTYRGERQHKRSGGGGGEPERRPYPAWLVDQVRQARAPLTRAP